MEGESISPSSYYYYFFMLLLSGWMEEGFQGKRPKRMAFDRVKGERKRINNNIQQCDTGGGSSSAGFLFWDGLLPEHSSLS